MLGGIPFLNDFVEKRVKRQTVADTVDHLNYYITAYLLGFFSLAISAKQYFGSPIQCWVPNEFKGGWEKYAEDYCFIANSYHVPFENELPGQGGEARDDHISYYRWVPIVLALQSIFFFLPNYFWNVVHKQTAINPRAFLKEAQKITQLTGEQRQEEVTKLANYFMDTVSVFGDANYRSKFRATPRSGKNAMYMYLVTKFFYVMNIFGQVVMLSKFLGENYLTWGYGAALSMVGGVWKEAPEAPVFPRVIMCDFQIRRLGNVQNHTVQCVIMMNMINEKLFLFLYFWFLVLAVVNVVSFFYYVAVMFLPEMRTRLVMFKVNGQKKGSEHRREVVENFVAECLHPDGVLLLQFVTEHVGGRVTFDLTTRLLALYSAQEVGYYRSFSDDSIAKHPHSPLNFSNPPSYKKAFFPSQNESLEEAHYMEQGDKKNGHPPV